MHLLFIFSRGSNCEGVSYGARQLSGFIIKNYVFPNLSRLSGDIQRVILRELAFCLQDNEAEIRKTSSILIGRISESYMYSVWEHLFSELLNLLDSQNRNAIDGALNAIQRICEDSCEKLNMETSRPLDNLIPKLLNFFQSSESSFRLKALSSMNSFIFLIPSNEMNSSSSRGELRVYILEINIEINIVRSR